MYLRHYIDFPRNLSVLMRFSRVWGTSGEGSELVWGGFWRVIGGLGGFLKVLGGLGVVLAGFKSGLEGFR